MTITLLLVASSSTDILARIAAELARDPRLKSPNSRRGYLADPAWIAAEYAVRSVRQIAP